MKIRQTLTFKDNNPKIIFSNLLNVPESNRPELASKNVPDWYKETAARIPNTKSPDSLLTIKNCMPVFDVMIAGYIIKTFSDVYVKNTDGEIEYTTALKDTLGFHPIKQAHLHPKTDIKIPDIPKWLNPWGIKTPKGYSTLFIPPAHNPNPWFECLPGLVDTDKYHAAVNFPFILKDPNFVGFIPKGTPIIQVIPFKRDEWSIDFINHEQSQKQSNDQANELKSRFSGVYKDLWRTIKKW